MGHNHFMDVPDDKLEALRAMVKRFRAGEEIDESALLASFGDTKYTKFSNKEKPVTEGQEELDFIKRLVRK
jgi:hypothetical protein